MADKNKPAYEEQDNSNQEHASEKELKAAAKNAQTDERKDVGGRRVSKEALEPKRIKNVGSALGLTPGAVVQVTLENGRQVPASVVAVHPGRPANRDIGLQEEKPSLDVKAATGNPDTGGTEMIFGIPVESVTANANF